MKSFIVAIVFLAFCISYSSQRALNKDVLLAHLKNSLKPHDALNFPPGSPLKQQQKDLDFGHLGLDDLGLVPEVVQDLIKKIVDFLNNGCSDANNKMDPHLMFGHKRRDYDLSGLGMDNLGLDDDIVKDLMEKINDLFNALCNGGVIKDNAQLPSIRKKRDLDFGGLLDGFGLDPSTIIDLIKKITDMITKDCEDSSGDTGDSTGAPRLIRRKRDLDLSGLGLGDLGLDDEVLQKLIKTITDFITSNEEDCQGSSSAVTGEVPKPTGDVPTTKPAAPAGSSDGPKPTGGVTGAAPTSPPPAPATTEGAKPPTAGVTTKAPAPPTDGGKPTPPVTQQPPETPSAATTRKCRPGIQLCFF